MNLPKQQKQQQFGIEPDASPSIGYPMNDASCLNQQRYLTLKVSAISPSVYPYIGRRANERNFQLPAGLHALLVYSS